MRVAALLFPLPPCAARPRVAIIKTIKPRHICGGLGLVTGKYAVLANPTGGSVGLGQSLQEERASLYLVLVWVLT